MKRLSQVLCLCLTLTLVLADKPDHAGPPDHAKAHGHDNHGPPDHAKAHGHDKHGNDHDHEHDHEHDHDAPDRCTGLEMDAVAVNEDGVPYFFKGHYLFKGFSGKAENSNESFAEMDDDHHLGHVDAAFRLHHEDGHDHDHMFFFLDDKVFSYYKHKLEDGFPKNISEAFPGIPDHLDAAVPCPKPDCEEDSVIFFKEHEIYHFTVKNKSVEEHHEFKTMPNCTAAFRFMEHYYCFHGFKFSRFDPKTGEVHGKYPKVTRDYFMKCANYSEDTDEVERERCSHVHLDAITSDHDGNMFAFRGHHYIRRDEGNDTLTVADIEDAFKEVHSDVDAVFTYEDHLYMIKDDKLFVYQSGDDHTLLEGYPKSVKEELGVDGHIDAAFVCEDNHIVHIIKDNHIYDVELKNSPRVPEKEKTMALFQKVDAAKCDKNGIRVIVGNHFYRFDSTALLVGAKALPDQHRVSMELFGCDH